MGLLIREYSESIFKNPTITKIPAEKIEPLFYDTTEINPSQVLALLYVLYYNHTLISFRNDTKIRAMGGFTGAHEVYPTILTEKMPIRRILLHAETFRGGVAYRTIYPDLLGLCANYYPELFDVVTLLMDEGRNDMRRRRRDVAANISEESLREILVNFRTKPEEALSTLRMLSTINPTSIVPYAQIIVSSLLPGCLEIQSTAATSSLLQSFLTVWQSLNTVIPRELWLMTVNSIRVGEAALQPPYTQQQLITDPLLIFGSVDNRIFRCPALFPMFLQVVSCYNAASKHKIWRRYFMSDTIKIGFHPTHINSMLFAQETSILHLLLESVTPSHSFRASEATTLIRGQVLNHLHQVFINDPRNLVVKILHFQTYGREMISHVVEGVQSSHQCIWIVEELVNIPDVGKVAFGLHLGGKLCEKFPMQATLDLASRVIIPRVRNLAFPRHKDGTPRNPRFQVSDTLVEALGCLVACTRAFPFLKEVTLQVLTDIREGLQLEPEQFDPRDPRGAQQRRLWDGLADVEAKIKKEASSGKNANKSIL